MTTVATPAAIIEAPLQAAADRGIYAIRQLIALCIIRRLGSITCTELAHELGISTAGVSVLSDALIHARLIQRTVSVVSEKTGRIDRRKFALTLTKEGREALTNILTA